MKYKKLLSMKVVAALLTSVAVAVPFVASAQSASTHATMQRQTMTDQYVVTRSGQYDYAPDVIVFGGNYHVYWCGSVVGSPGDHILHAQSASIAGPYHASFLPFAGTYDIALAPTGGGSFDGQHTCDPSVVKASGSARFTMYYGGAALKANGTATAIGVAQSFDGVHFFRANNGQPIVKAANTSAAPANAYGAGQPAVFMLGGMYYLSFTDTTGAGANPYNGAGQFLLRSTSPTFDQNTQELSAPGTWVASQVLSGSVVTAARFSYLQANSIDVAVDPMTNTLLIASNQVAASTWIYTMHPSFTSLAQPQYVAMAGTWRDGPSIAKNADRTMLARPACNSATVSVFKGDSTNSNYGLVQNWDIAMAQGTIAFDSTMCAH